MLFFLLISLISNQFCTNIIAENKPSYISSIIKIMPKPSFSIQGAQIVFGYVIASLVASVLIKSAFHTMRNTLKMVANVIITGVSLIALGYLFRIMKRVEQHN